MNEEKTRLMLPIASLGGACILAALVSGLMNQANTKGYMTFLVLAVIFHLIFVFYLRILKESLFEQSFIWVMLSGAYFISFVLLCNPYEISNYPFWLLGIACVAIYADVTLSLIMMYSLIFISMGASLFSFKELMIPMIIGTFLCLMVRFLRGFRTFFYLCVLLLSMSVTLSFVMNGFDEKNVIVKDNLMVIGSYFLVLFLLFVVIRLIPVSKTLVDAVDFTVAAKEELFRDEMIVNNSRDSMVVTNNRLEATTVSDEKESAIALQSQEGSRSNEANQEQSQTSESSAKQLEDELRLVVSEEAPLMMELKKESEKLYQHSMLIGTISQRAANSIGANEAIACAGGWYHEIGRLKGQDYIQGGVELIKEHQLPEVLADVIRQHNYKVDQPKSREAAIVMLTDNIMSTITYLKKNQEVKIGFDKVVENTFTVLLNKKALDEAGFDIASLMRLKDFYLSMVEGLKE